MCSLRPLLRLRITIDGEGDSEMRAVYAADELSCLDWKDRWRPRRRHTRLRSRVRALADNLIVRDLSNYDRSGKFER